MNFIIPGFYEQKHLNMALVMLMKKKKQYFVEDVKIGAIYDTFHISIWEGGRTVRQYNQAAYEDMTEIRDFYGEHDIPVRFTYTSSIIQPEDLDDTFCNLTLEVFDTGKNEVLINSPLLENYIREHYPNYDIISSTTKRLDQMDQFVEELKHTQYKQVCADFDLNNRWELYEQIPKELLPKVELLCNSRCVPGCPFRKEHYLMSSKSVRDYVRSFPLTCPMPPGAISNPHASNRNSISLEMIQTKYAPYGFEWFKLEGRSLPEDFYQHSYANYLVKPKYHDKFLADLVKTRDELRNRR